MHLLRHQILSRGLDWEVAILATFNKLVEVDWQCESYLK